jgi:hypothetical protein
MPISGSNHDLAQIQKDLQSDRQGTRCLAMQTLLSWAKKDSQIHPIALQMFRDSLATEEDPWTANRAISGIEHIVGPDQSRAIRFALLAHPRPELVAGIVLGIEDPSYADVLINVLSRRPETNVQIAVIRKLGSLRDDAALPALVGCLDVAELRPHAVEALGDLGNAYAIADLKPLLNDITPAWEVDNHGPMLRVCDLAKSSIERLRRTVSRFAAPRPDARNVADNANRYSSDEL